MSNNEKDLLCYVAVYLKLSFFKKVVNNGFRS